MDPEVSSTKTSSFGVMSDSGTRAGGCRISVKWPPRPNLPFAGAACDSTASLICSPATPYFRMKSLLGISVWLLSLTKAEFAPVRSTLIACELDCNC